MRHPNGMEPARAIIEKRSIEVHIGADLTVLFPHLYRIYPDITCHQVGSGKMRGDIIAADLILSHDQIHLTFGLVVLYCNVHGSIAIDPGRRPERIPGIGPAVSTALVAAVGDASELGGGRELAARTGGPRQRSTGARTVLLGISKRFARCLFTGLGRRYEPPRRARTVAVNGCSGRRSAEARTPPPWHWRTGICERHGHCSPRAIPKSAPSTEVRSIEAIPRLVRPHFRPKAGSRGRIFRHRNGPDCSPGELDYEAKAAWSQP